MGQFNNDIGIHILAAHAFPGGLYAEFEIRTDALGGFERWRWQSGGSQAKLWLVVTADDHRLIAEGERLVYDRMRGILARAHTSMLSMFSYSEFQFYVRGWIAGDNDAHPR
jgi:hypothetical protein